MSVAMAGVAAIGIGFLALTLNGGTSAEPLRRPDAEAPVAQTMAPATTTTPATTTSPSIVVTRFSGLRDLEQVAVTGTGYTPSGNDVWLGQCAGRPGPAPICDREAAHQVHQQVDANGKFSRSITMHETFMGASSADLGHLISVDCRVAPGCFISAGQADPNLAAFQIISFG